MPNPAVETLLKSAGIRSIGQECSLEIVKEMLPQGGWPPDASVRLKNQALLHWGVQPLAQPVGHESGSSCKNLLIEPRGQTQRVEHEFE